MLPNVIEFYNYNDELWYRTADGSNNRYEETSTDITDFMIEYIDKFYPKAYEVRELRAFHLSKRLYYCYF